MGTIPTIGSTPFARLPIQQVFDRAEASDASSIVTGTALHYLRTIARKQAWELFHADNKRGTFQVDESAVIRGRKVTIKLFISVYGAVYCTRWTVDGWSWTAAEVNQTFGF